MKIAARVTRTYGSYSYYGPEAKTSPLDGPAVLHDFPEAGSTTSIELGSLPDYVTEGKRFRSAFGRLLMEDTFLRTAPSESAARLELLDQYLAELPEQQVETGLQWFVTFAIEKDVEADEGKVFINEPLEWLHPAEAYSLERRLLREAAEPFDLLATYLGILLTADCFEARVFEDHVTFLHPGKAPLYWPHFKLEGSLVRASVGQMPFDGGLAQALFAKLDGLPGQRHDWLRTLAHWHMRSLHEPDSWRRFLWAFMSLEILVNKRLPKSYDRVLSALSHDAGDGPARKPPQSPIGALMFPRPQSKEARGEEEPRGMPYDVKFAHVALDLFPDRASDDLEQFRILRRARNSISHGTWPPGQDPPSGDCVDLLRRYLTAAIRAELGV